MKTTNLSLAEAHKSGRKYRRPGWLCKDFIRFEHDNLNILLENALATDYELEPEAKLLTREEVRRAITYWVTVTAEDRLANRICYELFGTEEG
jgi:hypothetical protein